MKKLIFLIMVMFGVSFSYPAFVSAQSMMGNIADKNNTMASESTGHTVQAAVSEGEPRLNHTRRGEAEGKIIWEKLQAKELNCENLSDDDFHSLGMHFMGVMVGSSHEAMDTMMEQMMGEEGEDQMHVAMGKRMSGCEPDAPMPQNMMGGGMMTMMMNAMMGSAFAPESFGRTRGGGNSMMGYGGWNGFGILGWLPMILFWTILILGVVALIRYLGRSGQHDSNNTPLEILKERYARGEINEKEFKEMKKDLT